VRSIGTAVIQYATTMAGKACLQERPIANIELATSQTAILLASENQYDT
jgi:hypothetical protein